MTQRNSSESSRQTKITGLVLAAGSGSRMKRTKQLLDYRGKPMLLHVINAAKASGLSKTVVVLGHDRENICRAIDLSGTETVINRSYQTGQSSSIRAGLAAVPTHHDGILFILGDQPLLKAELINRILNHFGQHRSPIVIPRFEGRRGNPVLIARSLFNELNRLSGDLGGRALFEKYSSDIDYVDVEDRSIHVDIDTPEDYDNLISEG